jgi:SAM-dependent methyltransferase
VNVEPREANLDARTVAGFGDEWKRFDQTGLGDDEARALFDAYFHVFPWSKLPANAVGFDLGCGSGRWAKLVLPRVGTLHCIDASNEALAVAKKNLARAVNAVFHNASVDAIPVDDASMDFGYSLGVLHHVPDTARGIAACAKKLKPGAPFLIYLYYAFDNRPAWFRGIWRASEAGRKIVSNLPMPLRFAASQAIAASVYLPLARASLLLEKAGLDVSVVPLHQYRHRSFYTMRTDALDRFGTSLEQRFSRDQITAMMERAGLERVTISDVEPHWCAVGYKRS